MLLHGLCVAMAFLAVPSQSADILVILPFPGYSHTMPFMPIFKELGARGHNLTLITPFEQKPNPKGFNQINIDFTLKHLKECMKKIWGGEAMSMKSLRFARGRISQLLGLWPICPAVSELVLQKTKPHLPPPGTKFDLVIMEPFFCMEPLMAASFLYNAPVVATVPMPLFASLAAITGNPQASSYIPSYRLPFTGDMSFLERTWNTIVNTVEIVGNHLYYIPRQDKLMREVLGHPELPYLNDIFQNISLVLAETHFTMNYPRPFLKNVVEVGGISVQLANPLPKDLEKYINEAKDGVIFFSWGSHFEAPDADHILEVFMKAFSKLKQRVLFKWATPDIPNKPNNVLVQKWFPQPSILAHNNTVLFISHCGLNSLYEGAHYGVPVLGTPMFGDQLHNIRILEAAGMAKGVDPEKLDDGTTFPTLLNEMLSNPSYRENAKKRSALLQDRPMPPVEEATYWIEYILRHGADHLQPATRKMPWYSIILLDVWLFIAVVIAIPVLVLCWAARACIRKCSRKPSKPVSQKKKKN